jgi:nicotinamide riboside kinase
MEENLRQNTKTGASEIIRIAIFGPESTGKTTLAKQLAEYYKTVWVPEFARDYLQEKLDSGRGVCDIDDMLPIAYGQTKLENESAAIANTYLFCDTNLMVTKVFSELYYNFCDSLLDKAARTHQYDLFFLTDIDVPWEDDGLRDSPEGRDSIFSAFRQSLIANKKPFITLSGDKETRLKKAVSVLNDLNVAKKMGIDSRNFVQIYEHGIPLERVREQLEFYQNGIPKAILDRPATVNDGILRLATEDFVEKAAFFDENKASLKLMKLVPASGAATRMFKFLNEFLRDYHYETESINAYINRKRDLELSLFIVGMDKFSFFEAIDNRLKTDFSDFEFWEADKKNYYFITYLLYPDYFDFASKPKGVLPFHKYSDHVATPFEEHLNECVAYAAVQQKGHLHFTITESHQLLFDQLEQEFKSKIESDSNTLIDVGYSYQDKSTDSITVDTNNRLARNQNKELLFRPGGHGALIENLNALDADIVFIKNIDNVIQNHIEAIALYKKGLAGVLLGFQQRVFSYLRAIYRQEVGEVEVDEIVLFVQKELNIKLDKGFSKFTFDNKVKELIRVLDRPIRVCGMVINEGEPGGGPFWVIDGKGKATLQIVESSQVDLKNEKQQLILESATHFNPVDLVCGIKNYQNQKFDLTRYVDPLSGFILERKLGNETIKSYELPGLWNGAMAKWITIFVEVPMVTFNPVKNVNDLLKPAHQFHQNL